MLFRSRAVVLNSGNANAATGEQGLEVARASARIVADALGCAAEEVLVASTGVIGVPLGLECFEVGVPACVRQLERSVAAAHHAARAVMTTDTHSKQAAYVGSLPAPGDGTIEVHVGGFAKGSGMIQPDMATMLSVLSTDAPLTPKAARVALGRAVSQSFNKVTVDSDTSTNDCCILFATGEAELEAIDEDSAAFPAICAALRATCEALARQIAADGEGSTRLVTVDVMGAATEADADAVARAVANSPQIGRAHV